MLVDVALTTGCAYAEDEAPSRASPISQGRPTSICAARDHVFQRLASRATMASFCTGATQAVCRTFDGNLVLAVEGRRGDLATPAACGCHHSSESEAQAVGFGLTTLRR